MRELVKHIVKMFHLIALIFAYSDFSNTLFKLVPQLLFWINHCKPGLWYLTVYKKWQTYNRLNFGGGELRLFSGFFMLFKEGVFHLFHQKFIIRPQPLWVTAEDIELWHHSRLEVERVQGKNF